MNRNVKWFKVLLVVNLNRHEYFVFCGAQVEGISRFFAC